MKKYSLGRRRIAEPKDLQYIRINGTVVGGIAGLLIYSLSWLIRPQQVPREIVRSQMLT